MPHVTSFASLSEKEMSVPRLLGPLFCAIVVYRNRCSASHQSNLQSRLHSARREQVCTTKDEFVGFCDGELTSESVRSDGIVSQREYASFINNLPCYSSGGSDCFGISDDVDFYELDINLQIRFVGAVCRHIDDGDEDAYDCMDNMIEQRFHSEKFGLLLSGSSSNAVSEIDRLCRGIYSEVVDLDYINGCESDPDLSPLNTAEDLPSKSPSETQPIFEESSISPHYVAPPTQDWSTPDEHAPSHSTKAPSIMQIGAQSSPTKKEPSLSPLSTFESPSTQTTFVPSENNEASSTNGTNNPLPSSNLSNHETSHLIPTEAGKSSPPNDDKSSGLPTSPPNVTSGNTTESPHLSTLDSKDVNGDQLSATENRTNSSFYSSNFSDADTSSTNVPTQQTYAPPSPKSSEKNNSSLGLSLSINETSTLTNETSYPSPSEPESQRLPSHETSNNSTSDPANSSENSDTPRWSNHSHSGSQYLSTNDDTRKSSSSPYSPESEQGGHLNETSHSMPSQTYTHAASAKNETSTLSPTVHISETSIPQSPTSHPLSSSAIESQPPLNGNTTLNASPSELGLQPKPQDLETGSSSSNSLNATSSPKKLSTSDDISSSSSSLWSSIEETSSATNGTSFSSPPEPANQRPQNHETSTNSTTDPANYSDNSNTPPPWSTQRDDGVQPVSTSGDTRNNSSSSYPPSDETSADFNETLHPMPSEIYAQASSAKNHTSSVSPSVTSSETSPPESPPLQPLPSSMQTQPPSNVKQTVAPSVSPLELGDQHVSKEFETNISSSNSSNPPLSSNEDYTSNKTSTIPTSSEEDTKPAVDDLTSSPYVPEIEKSSDSQTPSRPSYPSIETETDNAPQTTRRNETKSFNSLTSTPTPSPADIWSFLPSNHTTNTTPSTENSTMTPTNTLEKSPLETGLPSPSTGTDILSFSPSSVSHHSGTITDIHHNETSDVTSSPTTFQQAMAGNMTGSTAVTTTYEPTNGEILGNDAWVQPSPPEAGMQNLPSDNATSNISSTTAYFSMNATSASTDQASYTPPPSSSHPLELQNETGTSTLVTPYEPANGKIIGNDASTQPSPPEAGMQYWPTDSTTSNSSTIAYLSRNETSHSTDQASNTPPSDTHPVEMQNETKMSSSIPSSLPDQTGGTTNNTLYTTDATPQHPSTNNNRTSSSISDPLSSSNEMRIRNNETIHSEPVDSVILSTIKATNTTTHTTRTISNSTTSLSDTELSLTNDEKESSDFASVASNDTGSSADERWNSSRVEDQPQSYSKDTNHNSLHSYLNESDTGNSTNATFSAVLSSSDIIPTVANIESGTALSSAPSFYEQQSSSANDATGAQTGNSVSSGTIDTSIDFPTPSPSLILSNETNSPIDPATHSAPWQNSTTTLSVSTGTIDTSTDSPTSSPSLLLSNKTSSPIDQATHSAQWQSSTTTLSTGNAIVLNSSTVDSSDDANNNSSIYGASNVTTSFTDMQPSPKPSISGSSHTGENIPTSYTWNSTQSPFVDSSKHGASSGYTSVNISEEDTSSSFKQSAHNIHSPGPTQLPFISNNTTNITSLHGDSIKNVTHSSDEMIVPNTPSPSAHTYTVPFNTTSSFTIPPSSGVVNQTLNVTRSEATYTQSDTSGSESSGHSFNNETSSFTPEVPDLTPSGPGSPSSGLHFPDNRTSSPTEPSTYFTPSSNNPQSASPKDEPRSSSSRNDSSTNKTSESDSSKDQTSSPTGHQPLSTNTDETLANSSSSSPPVINTNSTWNQTFDSTSPQTQHSWNPPNEVTSVSTTLSSNQSSIMNESITSLSPATSPSSQPIGHKTSESDYSKDQTSAPTGHQPLSTKTDETVANSSSSSPPVINTNSTWSQTFDSTSAQTQHSWNPPNEETSVSTTLSSNQSSTMNESTTSLSPATSPSFQPIGQLQPPQSLPTKTDETLASSSSSPPPIVKTNSTSNQTFDLTSPQTQHSSNPPNEATSVSTTLTSNQSSAVNASTNSLSPTTSPSSQPIGQLQPPLTDSNPILPDSLSAHPSHTQNTRGGNDNVGKSKQIIVISVVVGLISLLVVLAIAKKKRLFGRVQAMSRSDNSTIFQTSGEAFRGVRLTSIDSGLNIIEEHDSHDLKLVGDSNQTVDCSNESGIEQIDEIQVPFTHKPRDLNSPSDYGSDGTTTDIPNFGASSKGGTAIQQKEAVEQSVNDRAGIRCDVTPANSAKLCSLEHAHEPPP